MAIGGTAGAIIGALFGGTLGCAAGATLGKAVDDNILDNHTCLSCGKSFSKTTDISPPSYGSFD
jgi:hypothetical protein